MSTFMMNWPDRLVEDLAKKKCVVFLGSGISANSENDAGDRPPTWRSLLEMCVNRITDQSMKKQITKVINNNDLLLACELIRRAMGRDDYNQFLINTFQKGYHSAEIHKEIFMLDAPIYITPNFDKIFDTYVTTETRGNTVIKRYDEDDILDFVRKGSNMILKIHGTIDAPDHLIFTKADYAKARIQFAGFYRILESLILTKTFLFIGAGLNDPDIQLMLENLAFTYKYSSKHFFVIPEQKDDLLKIYSENMKLQFITYNKKDNHVQLLEGLRQLNQQVSEYVSSCRIG